MSDADFEIDLEARTARHVQTGTVFSFYAYATEEDWAKALPSAARLTDDSPRGAGLANLAGAAKDAAVAVGMKGQR